MRYFWTTMSKTEANCCWSQNSVSFLRLMDAEGGTSSAKDATGFGIKTYIWISVKHKGLASVITFRVLGWENRLWSFGGILVTPGVLQYYHHKYRMNVDHDWRTPASGKQWLVTAPLALSSYSLFGIYAEGTVHVILFFLYPTLCFEFE